MRIRDRILRIVAWTILVLVSGAGLVVFALWLMNTNSPWVYGLGLLIAMVIVAWALDEVRINR